MTEAEVIEKQKLHIESLEQIIRRLSSELNWANEKYKAQELRHYGRKSEKYSKEDDIQGRLFDEAEANESEKPEPVVEKVAVPAHERSKRGRKPKPTDLPVREVLHELDATERACPCCGKERPCIGEERTEEFDLVPAHVEKIVHVMKSYGPCDCESFAKAAEASAEAQVIRAPGPAKLVKGSDFTNQTIAFFLTAKYVDALPFYRLSRMLERSGLIVSRAGLSNLAMAAGREIGDLVEAMNRDIVTSPVMLMDETTVQVLREGEGPPGKSYMWCAQGYWQGRPIKRFAYHPSRSGSFADALLGDFRGFLQTDGYSGYNHLDGKPGIVHVGCLAHVRRKFVEAWEVAGKQGAAKEAVDLIAKIYRNESELRAALSKGTMDERSFTTTRAESMKPLFARLRAWVMARGLDTAPQSKLGKAVSYAQAVFDRCVRFVEHPWLTPDTNAVENAIRPFVVGRKNWLFSGSPRGAHASAGLYSLIETAKANDHEPYVYLCYLFDELPKCATAEEREALLPYKLSPSAYAGAREN